VRAFDLVCLWGIVVCGLVLMVSCAATGRTLGSLLGAVHVVVGFIGLTASTEDS
jgi:hypothetical protein